MQYSNIKKIRVKNFRSLGDVTVSFEKSPIICLTGDNESGKTSIVKAFTVGGMNGLGAKHKAFIRRGTQGFGIKIDLEDGTTITRVKTAKLNTLEIENKDKGTEWRADKIDRGYGTPVELQKVMGLMEEPETKEKLQVRTYEDNLLFVVTSGSTNYKIMYDALKVQQLTNAIRIGNDEANSLKKSIDKESLLVKEYTKAMQDIRIVDIEPAVKLKDRLKRQERQHEKLEKTKRLVNEYSNLQATVSSFDDNLQEVDTDLYEKLEKTKRLVNEYNELQNQTSLFDDNLQEVDTGLLEKLEKTQRLKHDTIDLYRELTEYNTQINKLNEILKDSGVQTVTCPKCGEIVVV